MLVLFVSQKNHPLSQKFTVKNLFFTFYSNRVECEELFCKTNIKLLKLIKNKIYFVKFDDI